MELSVCMIVKDEAGNIARAVESASKVADEIIILDTGSRDGTREILTAMGQPFDTHEWRDSFAEARNASIAKATKPWIMWMDADDVITDDCAMRIRALKEQPPVKFYMFHIKNVDPKEADVVGYSPDSLFMQFRMFPNFKGVRFEGRVHEQIIVDPLNASLAEDVVVEHHGYASKEHIKASLRRNIRLQMIGMGFPENTDFFSFEVGPDIFCIYHPATLAIWYRKTFMTTFNPFVDEVPQTAEGRFQMMKDKVKIYLQSHLDALRVSLKPEMESWCRDIETALNTGEFNVCPVA